MQNEGPDLTSSAGISMTTLALRLGYPTAVSPAVCNS